MSKKFKPEELDLGIDKSITRRDFLGSTLIGAGAGLLAMNAPGVLAGGGKNDGRIKLGPLGQDWTGPGGYGDYARANGNTHEVVNTAHALRDGTLREAMKYPEETGELYDLVVVGGGFSGLGAAYAFKEEVGDKKRCLILDNSAVFGGEGKQNEFMVDGHHLYGPQGSNSFVVNDDGSFPEIWHKLGLPTEFEFEKLSGTHKDIVFAPDNFGPMMKWPDNASTGYFYNTESGGEWVKNAQLDGFKNAPIDESFRNDLNNVLNNRIKPKDFGENWEQQMDSMTYHKFLVDQLGVSEDVLYKYVDPYFASAAFGVSGDAISAYGAYKLQMPGTLGHLSKEKRDSFNNRNFYGWPGGNATTLRHLVKDILPEAIKGGRSLKEIGYGPINFDALDKPGNQFRIRLSSTAINVRHEGVGDGQRVVVTYFRDGKVHRVSAKAVVMATGGWITRRVVTDMPQSIANAYQQFNHTPMLSINVALKNWKFMENLGVSAARWFAHYSWYANIRQPMKIDGSAAPLDPSKPVVMTLYVPFVQYAGRSLREQAVLGRTELFSKSYRDYELEIRKQLTTMFGPYGFDAKRDIAGIVLNRWGHAYIAPQTGFYFGGKNEPAPRQVVDEGYGRIAFGHSEITGFQAWISGCSQGRQAVEKILKYATA